MEFFKTILPAIVSISSMLVAWLAVKRAGPRSREALLKDIEILSKLAKDNIYRERIEVHINKTIKRLYYPVKFHSPIDIFGGLAITGTASFLSIFALESKSLLWFSISAMFSFAGAYVMSLGFDEQHIKKRKLFWKKLLKRT
jgi:hypothetical protein